MARPAPADVPKPKFNFLNDGSVGGASSYSGIWSALRAKSTTPEFSSPRKTESCIKSEKSFKIT